MAGAAVSPALGEITLAFPDASQTLIKLVNTLHAIFIIPFTFISSWLTRYFSKKNILLVGLVIYMIAGIGGAFPNTIWMLLATRALLGIGVGLIMPISTSLVSDFYDGTERTAMMGRVSASNQLGGMVSMILAGLLAAISWRFTFGVYALGIPVFLMVLFYLPTPPKTEQKYDKDKTAPFNKKILGLAFAMFAVFVFFYSIPTNMAIFLQENNFASTAVIGFVIPISTLGGLTGGLLLAKIKHIMGSYLIPVQITSIGVGFSLIGFSGHIIPITIGIFILGLGSGTLIPAIYNGVATVTNGVKVMGAMALVQSFMYLGQFSSPIILNLLGSVFGNSSNMFIYQMSAGLILVIGLIIFVWTIITRKKGGISIEKENRISR